MNNILKSTLAAAALSTSVAVQADLSANVGFVTDYYFRGANLGDAGAYGGVDYENAGFYAGTWIIDDGTAGNDGLETDFYFGYGFDLTDSISVGLGYTRYDYTYTGDFEHEINLYVNVGAFGFEYSDGKDEDDATDTETAYEFIALSWSGEVFGATFGDFDNTDTNDGYSYLEVSASGEVNGFDATVTIGDQIDAQTGGVSSQAPNSYIVLDIGKSFDL